MYKLVIFDLDGTLADTDLMVVDAFLQLFKKYRKDYKPTFQELSMLSGPTLVDSMNKYFYEYDCKELIEEFRSISLSMYYSHTFLYPGVYDLIKLLKSENIKVCLLTNKLSSATNASLKLYGCLELFDEILSADTISEPKPSPVGIIECANKYKIDLSDTIYVGDSKIDELTAINANVDCCLVTYNVRGKLSNTNSMYYATDVTELQEVIFHGK